MMTSNNAPKCKWFRFEMACGTVRQKLYVDGKETPWFVDSASVRAHYSYGDKHGLWGAGMSEPHWLTKTRSAACFGSGSRLEPLKARAEQMALNAMEMA